MSITFTVDLEDPTEQYLSTGRYVQNTQKILNLCGEMGFQATFFTVGKLAKANPSLIRKIATEGHEIAYHSHAHTPLVKEEPQSFRTQIKEDKDALEQMAGQRVAGYRAPGFSLTPQSRWAIDLLHEAGFLYSSSVMPTQASLYGYPNAPTMPFLWPCGLVELPLPISQFGRLKIPYLGGIYLYITPWFLVRHMIQKSDPREILWTYTHPYDFDRWEPYKPMPQTPLWVSLILWISRQFATSKIKKCLGSDTNAGPLIKRLPSDKSQLDVFRG